MDLHEILRKLSCTGSTARKKTILKANASNEALQAVLHYTYEPLKVYYIKKIAEIMPDTFGEETVEDSITSWSKLLERLANGSLSGNAAKQEVYNTLMRFTQQDAKLMAKIICKHLDVGVSTATITATMPNLISNFGCMLADKFDGNLGGGMYMSLKLDGLRGILHNGRIYTRNGRIIQGVEHISSQFSSDISLDGELTIPGNHFQDTSGMIRSHKASPDAVFNVFDIPFTDMHFVDRLEMLNHMNLNTYKNVVPVKHIFTDSLVKVQETMDKAIAAGYEGLVLKTRYHRYQTKRSKDWLKIKLVESEDLPVVDTFEGEGKYTGMIGGLIVKRDNGVLVRVGSGLSDAQRKIMPDDFIGRTAEVLYHEETPDGSLRHPRLKCFREDK